MDLLFPYEEPYRIAEELTEADLKAMVKSLEKSIQSSAGQEKEFLERCKISMTLYLNKNFSQSRWWSCHAGFVKPAWLTPARCHNDRERLYHQFPKKYAKFNDSGDAGAAEKA